MREAAVYARYSSSLQSPTSVDDQLDVCRKAAARFGYAVDGHVYTDREISGSVASRPGYQRLMAAAKAKQFDAVIVEAQDRLWRDQAEMHDALKRLRFWGVKVLPAATGVDLTDPMTGGALATISGLQDEMFLRNLGEKTHRGMEGQIGRGLSAGGRPYGYRLERSEDGKKKNSRLVIDEAEAAVVRRIFVMRKSGMGRKAITRRLNEERVPPPRPRRGERPRGWTPNTIEGDRRRGLGILNNPLYVGEVVWNRTRKDRDPDDPRRRVPRLRPEAEWVRMEMPELRIVPQDLWDAVKAMQKETTRRTEGGKRNRPHRHLLSGLLRCACGAHYVKRDATFYECSDHRLGRGCENGRLARQAVLEERVLAAIEDQILSPQNLARLTLRCNEELRRLNSSGAEERRAMEAQLREADRKLQNIKDAILEGIRTPSTRAMLEEWEEKVQRLRAEARNEPKVTPALRALPSLIEAEVRDLRLVLMGAGMDERRFRLSRLLGGITLRPDGTGLVAEVRGDLGALLGGSVDTGGAGRGI